MTTKEETLERIYKRAPSCAYDQIYGHKTSQGQRDHNNFKNIPPWSSRATSVRMPASLLYRSNVKENIEKKSITYQFKS